MMPTQSLLFLALLFLFLAASSTASEHESCLDKVAEKALESGEKAFDELVSVLSVADAWINSVDENGTASVSAILYNSEDGKAYKSYTQVGRNGCGWLALL